MAELKDYRHYIVLENEQGNRFAVLNLQNIEALHCRQHKPITQEDQKIDLIGAVANGPKEICKIYSLEKGWMFKLPPSDMLYFAYLKLMEADYLESVLLLKRAVSPLERPYVFEEIKYLWWIVASHMHKADSHPDAMTIRFYAAHEIWLHLKQYPLPKSTFDRLEMRERTEYQNWLKNFEALHFTLQTQQGKWHIEGSASHAALPLDSLFSKNMRAQFFDYPIYPRILSLSHL